MFSTPQCTVRMHCYINIIVLKIRDIYFLTGEGVYLDISVSFIKNIMKLQFNTYTCVTSKRRDSEHKSSPHGYSSQYIRIRDSRDNSLAPTDIDICIGTCPLT